MFLLRVPSLAQLWHPVGSNFQINGHQRAEATFGEVKSKIELRVCVVYTYPQSPCLGRWFEMIPFSLSLPHYHPTPTNPNLPHSDWSSLTSSLTRELATISVKNTSPPVFKSCCNCLMVSCFLGVRPTRVLKLIKGTE